MDEYEVTRDKVIFSLTAWAANHPNGLAQIMAAVDALVATAVAAETARCKRHCDHMAKFAPEMDADADPVVAEVFALGFRRAAEMIGECIADGSDRGSGAKPAKEGP